MNTRKLIAVIEDLATNACPEVRLFPTKQKFLSWAEDGIEVAWNRAPDRVRSTEEAREIRRLLDAAAVEEAWDLFINGLCGDTDEVELRNTDDRYYVRHVDAPQLLSEREAATVLAALRYAQSHPRVLTGQHFDNATALGSCEIDELCERLNLG